MNPRPPDSELPALDDESGREARRLSAHELALFEEIGERRVVAAGELIFRRGEHGRTMFVVVEGQVALEFGDGMRDKRIGASEYFGELAFFIGNHARLASAVACGPCLLVAVSNGDFDTLLDQQPGTIAHFMRRSFAYLVNSEQQLILNLKRRNEELLLTLDSLRQTRTRLTNAEHLVQTDELTGLRNRRGLYAHLDEIEHAPRPGVLGLLLIDLDDFKTINDSFGHITGDRVLEAVAGQLKRLCGEHDMPARLGGDEFAVLVWAHSAEDIEQRARALVDSVRLLAMPEPLNATVLTISVGAVVCEAGASWSVWYSQADRLLYRAKAEGGDDFRFQLDH
ncbi:diguanylate cyclase domain-containing protein [Aquimonas sp.]|jgi:diguanylate cyclase (GGDEF)-like protein|uniref:GGDEF domain-containing protein n=1 Tax=Aquimonas sp. TaxID=1872588 RepID=UPI0037C01F32